MKHGGAAEHIKRDAASMFRIVRCQKSFRQYNEGCARSTWDLRRRRPYIINGSAFCKVFFRTCTTFTRHIRSRNFFEQVFKTGVHVDHSDRSMTKRFNRNANSERSPDYLHKGTERGDSLKTERGTELQRPDLWRNDNKMGKCPSQMDYKLWWFFGE